MIQKAIRGGVACGSGSNGAPAQTVSAAAAGGQTAASSFQQERKQRQGQPEAAGPSKANLQAQDVLSTANRQPSETLPAADESKSNRPAAAEPTIIAHQNGLLELNQGPAPPLGMSEGPPPQANSSTHAKEWARWQRRIRQNAKSGMFPSQQAAYFQGGKAKLDAFSIFVAANGNQAAVEARMLQAGLMFTGCHAE